METPKITTAQQIKDIIEPIPAELFQINFYGYTPHNMSGDNSGSEDNGKSCVLGHIHRHFNPKDKGAHGDCEGYGARMLSEKYILEHHSVHADLSSVNNYATVNGYTEPVIKDRVMHLVEDMIKAGY